jgi:hypothetical protein
MLVVGDCQRCYANDTNTNNGGRLASGWEEHKQGRETPTRAKRNLSATKGKIVSEGSRATATLVSSSCLICLC